MADFLPYTRHDITAEDRAAVDRVLRSSHLTQGPEVEAFEAELCEVTGAKYAVVVASGTAALHCLYAAVAEYESYPFQPSWSHRAPLLPAISFVATANMLVALGHGDNEYGAVQFHDMTPTETTDAVDVWVSIGGDVPNCTPVPILDLAHALGAPVDFDACLGATYSFHPAKHVTTGEGGAVCTNREDIATFCRQFRSHGRVGTSQIQMGFNYRLPDLNAALGRSQLTRLRWSIQRRREIAARYDTFLAGTSVALMPHSERSSRHLYQVLVTDRDAVAAKLNERGIGTAVHYPVIPLQPWWQQRYGYTKADFPLASAWADSTLSLPLFPTMTDADVQRVITAVQEVCG